MNSESAWEAAWKSATALPDSTPQWVVAVLALVCIYLLVLLPSGAVVSYLERKLSADLQARVGPSRSGPAGLLQPFADFIKLLQKEAKIPENWRETLWQAAQTMALFSTVAALPLGSLLLLVDTDMSVFIPFWAAFLLALVTMLTGLSQQTVPGWFGGFRLAAQALAGGFPALITLLCTGVRAGSFSWSALVGSQGASPFSWGAFTNPFEFLAMFIFTISGLVLLGISPLDGSFSVPDLHGGVSSQYFGKKLSLYRLSRFYAFFLWSTLTAALFLGGWKLPDGIEGALREHEAWRSLAFLELIVLLIKTFLLMGLVVLIGSVTPRLRSDQITDLAWKVLSPLSLLALAGTAIWRGWMALS